MSTAARDQTRPELEAEHREVFLAIVVVHERRAVLHALTRQAVEHFGHDELFVGRISVAASDSGTTFLASAPFTTVTA